MKNRGGLVSVLYRQVLNFSSCIVYTAVTEFCVYAICKYKYLLWNDWLKLQCIINEHMAYLTDFSPAGRSSTSAAAEGKRSQTYEVSWWSTSTSSCHWQAEALAAASEISVCSKFFTNIIVFVVAAVAFLFLLLLCTFLKWQFGNFLLLLLLC